MFEQLLAFSGPTTRLVGFIGDIEGHSLAPLFIPDAVPFLLCLFIDQVALMLVVIPIYSRCSTARPSTDMLLLFLINITLGG